jgi:AraC-like DNA-binding protein
MPIKELERKTGYTRRYLDLLFKHHVGLSPKGFGRDLPISKVLPEMGPRIVVRRSQGRALRLLL